MKYKFGKMFLVDLEHKMSVVSDCPELQEDYGVTQEEIDTFLHSIFTRPEKLVIDIPDKFLPIVKGEMQNMADIAWCNARSEGISAIGWATSIEKQLEKIK